MKKASQESLGALHAKVAEKILSMLDDPEKESQGLILAIKFLKDNNIQADPAYNELLNQVESRVDIKTLPFPTKVS